jgi:hypothetical protein
MIKVILRIQNRMNSMDLCTVCSFAAFKFFFFRNSLRKSAHASKVINPKYTEPAVPAVESFAYEERNCECNEEFEEVSSDRTTQFIGTNQETEKGLL